LTHNKARNTIAAEIGTEARMHLSRRAGDVIFKHNIVIFIEFIECIYSVRPQFDQMKDNSQTKLKSKNC